MFILKRFAQLLESKPLKTILLATLMIFVLAIGIQNVEMATGNDTLVSSGSKVYQDNLALEKEFGGESIIIMYESDKLNELLTIENLEHMEGLEQQLEANENVYSIISPVMLVKKMTEKQADKYQEGLSEVIEGLDKTNGKLNDIGDNLITNAKSGSDSQLSSQQFDEIDHGLVKMIEGQTKLQDGTQRLVTGFNQFGEQIGQVGIAVDRTVSSMTADQQEEQQQIKQLKQYSQNLIQLSEQMNQSGSKSEALPEVPQQTKKALTVMQSGLEKQKNQLASMQEKQKQQQAEFKKLGSGLKEMGDRLKSISENLARMQKYSDPLSPGLPETQKTLDQIIYNEDGQLKDVFNRLILDEKYMLMSIKFNGEVSDADKSEVVESINSYLVNNPLITTETMLSGKPVLDGAIRSSMQDSMKKMMMLAIIAMVIVLLIIFKIRWCILPLGIVLLAVVGTVGFMGWGNIPITMVSMAVFPILIGLGIDYAIQFQSRYTEEMKESEVLYESE